MPTYTTRTALVKPSASSSPAEPVDVAQLNANADQIDRFLGCMLVNDTVVPGTNDLFDGAIVRERNSGIIWEARKNGGGTFDKVYIRYPYSFLAQTVSSSVGASTTPGDYGWNAFVATGSKNASTGELNASNFWVCPVKGIYLIRVTDSWDYDIDGLRVSQILLSGGLIAEAEKSVSGNSVGAGKPVNIDSWVGPMALSVGDIVSHKMCQDSGGALNLTNSIHVTMIEPIQ